MKEVIYLENRLTGEVKFFLTIEQAAAFAGVEKRQP
jgi:hypothetical protein